MSREERKMAQIIASIERMEQEARVSGDDASKAQDQLDWTRQGGRGKRGKKSKLLGVRIKAGKKLKVSSFVPGTEIAMSPYERKLTPKKRWIQLWSDHLNTNKYSGSLSDCAENNVDGNLETEKASKLVVAKSHMSDINVPLVLHPELVTVVEMENRQNISERPVDALAYPARKLVGKTTPAQVLSSGTEKEVQERTTEASEATMVNTLGPGDVSISSSKLRVKTPLNNESSHLSPPLERNSPTNAASISPSAKVKESDTPNSNTAMASATKLSPAATEQETPVVTDKKNVTEQDNATPMLERKSTSSSSSAGKADENNRRDTSDCLYDYGRKRSVDNSESPISEETKRRAERRRKRKTNWDVGDPRMEGSPITDTPISAAGANQQSIGKVPPTRPSWRHSQSMMDMRPNFQSNHRSSSFYSSGPHLGGRRAFYHSSSLPEDRSRSAGRSSTRYSSGNSSNYRCSNA
ncbi:hypothetical protein PsorP6_002784 [Peronosclerospora sorghi]|uniref:Uncharacterized protein n=1 Tax=Peronosclerospora sorghi TaxID=230839 RepID=A0ACC0VJX0_9STRA|nr:hypothetical protein PsorP6_002784 [Peronosclerospora sorghi]